MFTNSPSAEVRVVEGGQHFLSASNPEDVNQATVEFVDHWNSNAKPTSDALTATAR